MRTAPRTRTTTTCSDSFGIAHWCRATCRGSGSPRAEISIDPAPGDLTDDVDYYGNVATYFHVTDPHLRLTIDALQRSRVRRADRYDARRARSSRGSARARSCTRDLRGAWRGHRASRSNRRRRGTCRGRDRVRRGIPHRPAGRVGEAVTDLMHRIYADFDYDTTATTVTSTVAEVLDKRAGVCQDFAHLTLAVPAQPRPGGPLRQRLPRHPAAAGASDRVVGADAVARLGRRVDARAAEPSGSRSTRPTTSGHRPLRHRRLGPRLRRRPPGQGRDLHRGEEVDAARRRSTSHHSRSIRKGDVRPGGVCKPERREGLPLPRLRQPPVLRELGVRLLRRRHSATRAASARSCRSTPTDATSTPPA